MARRIFSGTLNRLVLKKPAQRGKLQGYGIAPRIQKASDELLVSERGVPETAGKTEYDRFTIAERKQVEAAQKGFEQLVKGVCAMLRYA